MWLSPMGKWLGMGYGIYTFRTYFNAFVKTDGHGKFGVTQKWSHWGLNFLLLFCGESIEICNFRYSK